MSAENSHTRPTRRITFRLNGRRVDVTIEPRETLIEMLRGRLRLTGAKKSCDAQVCGACTVLVDGLPASSCTMLAYEARGREVLTIEGLAEQDRLHPLQQAFIDCNGFQCGFCTPGMILAAKALLDENPRPSESEIRDYMNGNICRCTGYVGILEAIRKVAGIPAGEAHGRP